jgi:hypothetical protein
MSRLGLQLIVGGVLITLVGLFFSVTVSLGVIDNDGAGNLTLTEVRVLGHHTVHPMKTLTFVDDGQSCGFTLQRPDGHYDELFTRHRGRSNPCPSMAYLYEQAKPVLTGAGHAVVWEAPWRSAVGHPAMFLVGLVLAATGLWRVKIGD